MILNFKKYGSEGFYRFSANKGQGTQEDPIVIHSSEKLPSILTLRHSAYHVQFEGCQFSLLKLRKCRNFRFTNCSYGNLQLESCTSNEIDGCKISQTLMLRKCKNNTITECSIRRFELIRSYNNDVKNSTLEEVENILSAGNKFNNLKIKEKNINDLLSSMKYTRIVFMIIPLVVLFMLIGTIRVWNIDFEVAIYGLFFICFIIILVSVITVINLVKMKKYGPNKML